ncbi:hypothetical protein P4K96_29525 [Bacillus cereus]|nr:hypothetical protein [Bacillus cereus]
MTFPLLLPIHFYVAIITTIGSFQIFDSAGAGMNICLKHKTAIYVLLVILGILFFFPFAMVILGLLQKVEKATADPLFWIPTNPTHGAEHREGRFPQRYLRRKRRGQMLRHGKQRSVLDERRPVAGHPVSRTEMADALADLPDDACGAVTQGERPLQICPRMPRPTTTTRSLTKEGNFGIEMAGAAISFVPTFLIFVFFQRYFTEGTGMSGIKS